MLYCAYQKAKSQRSHSTAERYAVWRATPYGDRIYGLFRRFAIQALESGRPRFGHKAIVERIRWYTQIEERSPDGLKINDHHSAHLARELIAEDPRFADFFEVRRLRSEG